MTVRAGSAYGNQVGFTGRYLDGESGLWYFRARMYSGSLGRFIGRDQYRKRKMVPAGKDGYPNGFNLYIAYLIPNLVDPAGNETYPVNCGTVTVNISNGATPPQITLSFVKDPSKKCCCKDFGWSQQTGRSPDGPWRFDNGAWNNLPANGIGASSNPNPPSGNQPGENDRPNNPNPTNGQSHWPGNPWYGGVNAQGTNTGGLPTPANPKPDGTNPNVGFAHNPSGA